MGFTKKCKGWYVGVIVNRHFINSKQWKIKDYSFDTRGQVKYCRGYIFGPVFKKISSGRKYGRAYLLKLRTSDVSELCRQNLFVVLNKFNDDEGKRKADSLMKQCLVRFGDGTVDEVDVLLKNPNLKEVHAFEFDKMTINKMKPVKAELVKT